MYWLLILIFISIGIGTVCTFIFMKNMSRIPIKLYIFLLFAQLCIFMSRQCESVGLSRWYKIIKSLSAIITPPYQSKLVKVRGENMDGVRVYIYEPKLRKAGQIPGVIYMHGGGWVLMQAKHYHTLGVDLAESLNVVVISIDYRLSPEHPYPQPLEDCMKATLYFLRNTERYGVDPDRVAIAGDSAGGNMAASIALKLHSDLSLPKLKLQVLLYPVTQAVDFNTPSYCMNAEDHFLPRSLMVEFFLMYLLGKSALQQRDTLIKEVIANNHVTVTSLSEVMERVNWCRRLSESDRNNHTMCKFGFGHPDLAPHFTQAVQDPYLSPLTGASDESLRRLPPVYLVTCKRDVLRDDGLMYKSRLEEVGVRVYHQEYDSLHGLFMFRFCGIAPEAETALGDLVAFFRESGFLGNGDLVM